MQNSERILTMTVLLWVLPVYVAGCEKEGECTSGDAICKDNRIMLCKGENAHPSTLRWDEYRNCSDFNARCQDGVATEYFDPGGYGDDHTAGIVSTDSSCVIDTYDCGDEEGYMCPENNDLNAFIVNCTRMYNGSDIFAAIGVVNWEERPFCVHALQGAAFAFAFAFAQDVCEEYAQMCSEEGLPLQCKYQTWQLGGSACKESN